MTYKIIDLAGSEAQQLVDSGVDRSSAATTVVDGMVLALSSVFLSMGLDDEEALIEAIQDLLRACKGAIEGKQPSDAGGGALKRLGGVCCSGRVKESGTIFVMPRKSKGSVRLASRSQRPPGRGDSDRAGACPGRCGRPSQRLMTKLDSRLRGERRLPRRRRR